MTHLVSDTFSSLKQLLLQYSFLYQCYSVNYGIMAEDDTVSAVLIFKHIYLKTFPTFFNSTLFDL